MFFFFLAYWYFQIFLGSVEQKEQPKKASKRQSLLSFVSMLKETIMTFYFFKTIGIEEATMDKRESFTGILFSSH